MKRPVAGHVRDSDGPVKNAVVRLQGSSSSVITSTDGSFILTLPTTADSCVITAWAPAYYVGWSLAGRSADSVLIELKRHYSTDNPEYTWFSHEGAAGSLSCSHCMPSYDEWIADAHSQSAVNVRFLTMYNGTDVYGNKSPPTRYGYNRDYGAFPLPPDPTKPYYGPGYVLDFPGSSGNCAACHIPAAAAKPGMAFAVNPNVVSGVDREGVFCEFCHKIGEVFLEPATGLPNPLKPGVLSLRLFRPFGTDQLFFGNFDDVTRRVTYLPLIQESAFCAPCHFGVFWNTVIYNSYGEWLDSPYSKIGTRRTCQDCHMPRVAYDYFVYPGKGGLIRRGSRILNHTMPGAADVSLLRNAVTMTGYARSDGDRLTVTVIITNDKTGHHIPTDSPLRHLILHVQASDWGGRSLQHLGGPVLPAWCGIGDPALGCYAGLPGKAFAKILSDVWTHQSPTGAYWNPTRIVSDNRIAAFSSDVSEFVFATPVDQRAVITVRLLYRRAFVELVDQKKWVCPDIEMASLYLTTSP